MVGIEDTRSPWKSCSLGCYPRPVTVQEFYQ